MLNDTGFSDASSRIGDTANDSFRVSADCRTSPGSTFSILLFALTAGCECMVECGETRRLLEYCDEADTIIEEQRPWVNSHAT